MGERWAILKGTGVFWKELGTIGYSELIFISLARV
jgi:hypothetical protein